jgi:uncharacterized protein (DUF849 family)
MRGEAQVAHVEALKPDICTLDLNTMYSFGSAEFGISRLSFQTVAQSVLLGGHVRVGMEDNLYLEKGVLARSNADLVAKAMRIVSDLGSRAASPSEARRILSLSSYQHPGAISERMGI